MLTRLQLAELVLRFFTREEMAIESMSDRDLCILADVKAEMREAAREIRQCDLHPLRDVEGIFADKAN